jgi:hypothetical protein
MTVNPQITDSITQTNVKVLGDAPAIAMGNLYQATSQALANAAHNATTNQQQINITAQAATVQGIAALYSLDTAATADRIKGEVTEAASAIQAAATPTPDLLAPIRQLVQGTSGSADEIAYGMRVTMGAVASSLEALSAASTGQLIRILQIAATSACLTAMIAQPEKASGYEEVLAAIRSLS